MISQQTYAIFKTGSVTYFNSSLFFPKEIKKDVFALYAFVRKADDFVDKVPADSQGFFSYKKAYQKANKGIRVNDKTITDFVSLKKKSKFEEKWIDAFLAAMESDLNHTHSKSLKQSLEYMYGSAEVIGLMMARILDLPDKAQMSARMLGRSMQYANFIRDIAEDYELGRNYFPATDMRKFKLKDLSEKTARSNPKQFKKFLQHQIKNYSTWQAEAETGFSYIPYRVLIQIKTASDMYKWTIKQIKEDPFVVYKRKVKPNKLRVFSQIIRNLV